MKGTLIKIDESWAVLFFDGYQSRTVPICKEDIGLIVEQEGQQVEFDWYQEKDDSNYAKIYISHNF